MTDRTQPLGQRVSGGRPTTHVRRFMAYLPFAEVFAGGDVSGMSPPTLTYLTALPDDGTLPGYVVKVDHAR